MNSINLENSIDLHIHPYPCLIPRIANDREVVKVAQEAGMEAVMLKCHHESTVSRAFTLQSEFSDIRIFGGIVLNEYVGGINPKAVEAALRLGAKEVWMPTIDADNHAQVHGAKGVYDVQSSGEEKKAAKGVTVLENDELTEDIKEVIKLIAEYDVILGTSHLSKKEIFVLVDEAIKMGVKKILITHPFFKVPNLNLNELLELKAKEVTFEFGYCTISPMWNYASVDEVYNAIKELGVENCVLISDGGQKHNPFPTEGLKIFAQCLFEKGLKEKEIDILIKRNPRKLLSLKK